MSKTRAVETPVGISNAVFRTLSSVHGMPLSRIQRISETRYFGFGGMVLVDGSPLSQYLLILQCSWRFESSGHIITGVDDAGIMLTNKGHVQPDVRTKSDTLLASKLAKMFRMESDEGWVPEQCRLVATHTEADDFGGFRLRFGTDFALSTFPAGTDGEFWRLCSYDDMWHFVVEPGRAYWIGEELPEFAI